MKFIAENTAEMYQKHKELVDLMAEAMKKMNNEDRSLFTHLVPQDVLTLIIYRLLEDKKA